MRSEFLDGRGRSFRVSRPSPMARRCGNGRLRRSVRSLQLAGWALLLAPSLLAEAPDSPALWKLLPTAQVDGSGIFLPNTVAGVDPGMAPESLRIAAAPGLNQTVVLSRAQINEAVERLRPDLSTNAWSWTGATQVRVTRKTRPLLEVELLVLLTTQLQSELVKNRGDLELRFRSPWITLLIPDERIIVKILEPSAIGVSPNLLLKFELWTARERVGEWQMAAQARLFREILVTRAPVKRGVLLRDAEVSSERRDVLGLREPLEGSPSGDLGSWELAENLAENTPVTARSVRMRPVVQRGRIVDAVVQDGALNISMKVEVLNDGLPGQTVRVRNPRTKREFAAKVQDEQTVLLNL